MILLFRKVGGSQHDITETYKQFLRSQTADYQNLTSPFVCMKCFEESLALSL